jgi:hypothetical protein
MRTHGQDLEIEVETYVLCIHVDYRFLKAADLAWVFRIINRGIRETQAKIGKAIEGEKRKEQRRLHIIIEEISTERSIEVNVLLASVLGSMAIIRYGYFLREVYNHLKRESSEKRYLGRRKNVSRIRMRLKKRTRRRDGTYYERIEDEFELEISGQREY